MSIKLIKVIQDNMLTSRLTGKWVWCSSRSPPHTLSSRQCQTVSESPSSGSTGREAEEGNGAPPTQDEIRPFGEIPGPRSLPIIGTLYHYLPVIGQYTFSRLHHTGLLKLKQFGPIVRERLVGDVTLLLLFDPRDIETMYSTEGRYPMRRSHTALEKYRLDRPHMYNTGGLLPTNGQKWWDIRRRAQKVLSRVQSVLTRLPHINKVTRDFNDLIDSVRCPQTGLISNFLDLERRLFLELTMVATVDVRLGCINRSSLNIVNKDAEDLLHAAHASNSCIIHTDNGLQLWRYFNTPLYKQLVRGQDTIYRIALKYVEAKEEELRKRVDRRERGVDEDNDRPLSVLEYFILESGLDKKDILGVVCDTLLAGIDTGAFTMSYVLHNLATNPDKQELLAAEARTLLARSGGEVTSRVLSEARYLKAVLKETYRLRPVSIGVGRIIQEDVVIRGYRIPKDTVVVTQNQVSCRLPEYFPDPDKFLPERWLKKENINPFLVLPFGHGPRACIGRRTAEQNLYTAVLQLVGRYNIGWLGRELDCYSNLINEPDASLEFTFLPRAAAGGVQYS
ncbi:cytochrome P450 302a1, mitochondrial-like [Homarus americanus]|uniref:cytochrome P450 302a1, mitochondrial-like n=1 Tax=Homarus americanus TaxID=6706 RepID=UPI001C45B6A9|nr:cytochrome P450 302a1, mitochondrial-like [Homarus americanus]